MRTITMLLTVLAVILPVFGQDKKTPEKKAGMVWHYFTEAQKCSVEWDTAFAGREQNFFKLAEKVKEGDVNKIRLYMGNVEFSQHQVALAYASGLDLSKLLENTAGRALLSKGGLLDLNGVMTEPEYDEAMKLVKSLKKKLEGRPVNSAQKKIWADALKAVGADSQFKLRE